VDYKFWGTTLVVVVLVIGLVVILAPFGCALWGGDTWQQAWQQVGQSVGSILILGVTAVMVVWYTAETRRLAEETHSLAKITEEQTMEGPRLNALWAKRLDCYCEIAGLLNLYSNSIRVGTDQETKMYECELVRNLSEATILYPGGEDPVLKCRLEEIQKLVHMPSPTPEDVADVLLALRKAVRESLQIAELEKKTQGALDDARV